MFETIAFIAACLLLPIAWGVLVNWLFERWRTRSVREESENDDDWGIPDYQI